MRFHYRSRILGFIAINRSPVSPQQLKAGHGYILIVVICSPLSTQSLKTGPANLIIVV